MSDARPDAERVIEAARDVLGRVEAVMSIVQPRSNTKEYLETLEHVRGVLAQLDEM